MILLAICCLSSSFYPISHVASHRHSFFLFLSSFFSPPFPTGLTWSGEQRFFLLFFFFSSILLLLLLWSFLTPEFFQNALDASLTSEDPVDSILKRFSSPRGAYPGLHSLASLLCDENSDSPGTAVENVVESESVLP